MKGGSNTLTIPASNGFPKLSFHRLNGPDQEWWIAFTTLQKTVFTPTIRNRDIYKELVTKTNLPAAVSKMLMKKRRLVKTNVSFISCALTFENFLTLLSSIQVNDVAWFIHPSVADVQAYIVHATKKSLEMAAPRNAEEKPRNAEEKPRNAEPRDAEKNLKRKVSVDDEPSHIDVDDDDDHLSHSKEEEDDPITMILKGDKSYAGVVRDAVKEEAIERYMMMPHIEARAQEMLAQQSIEMRGKAMELMRSEVDKAVAEYMTTRSIQLEGELKESVIQQLAQRPDIIEQARNVALVGARILVQKEKMQQQPPQPKRVRFEHPEMFEHLEMFEQASHPFAFVMPAKHLLEEFKKDHPN